MKLGIEENYYGLFALKPDGMCNIIICDREYTTRHVIRT